MSLEESRILTFHNTPLPPSIYLDTSFVLSFCTPKSKYYRACASFIKRLSQKPTDCYISPLVMDEVAYAIIQIGLKDEHGEEWESVRKNNPEIIQKYMPIEGDDQQKLNAMIRKYAFQNGMLFNKAWGDFKQAFNTAYHTNLESLITNHMKKNRLKKLSIPQYLNIASKLTDGIRVADKMLNGDKKTA